MQVYKVQVAMELTVYGDFSTHQLAEKLKQYAAVLPNDAAIYTSDAQILSTKPREEEK